MPDTYMETRAKAVSRNHVRAEWDDMRPALDRIVLKAQSLVSATRDIPLPLYADERKELIRRRAAFIEQISDALHDFLGDVTGPVSRRSDDAGGGTLSIDLTEFNREVEGM